MTHEHPTFTPSDAPVTEVLNQWHRGSQAAGERLLPMIYRQLRAIAGHHLRGERQGHTLQATALVHEAFLRLQSRPRTNWQNRLQFMAFSARLMRQILVDHARTRGRQKRGGAMQPLSLDSLGIDIETYPGIIALDDALRDLALWDRDKALLVELRYFGGLTTDEIATLTEVSCSTVERRWRSARAWLYQHLAANDS